jgi:hypothetical protein
LGQFCFGPSLVTSPISAKAKSWHSKASVAVIVLSDPPLHVRINPVVTLIGDGVEVDPADAWDDMGGLEGISGSSFFQ